MEDLMLFPNSNKVRLLAYSWGLSVRKERSLCCHVQLNTQSSLMTHCHLSLCFKMASSGYPCLRGECRKTDICLTPTDLIVTMLVTMHIWTLPTMLMIDLSFPLFT